MSKFIAAACLSLLAASAHSADANGVYGGLDLGTSKVAVATGHYSSFGVFGGYQLAPQLAVEGSYRRLASVQYFASTGTTSQAAISAMVTAPLAPQWAVFGRLGYNQLDLSVGPGGYALPGKKTSALLGLGARFSWTPDADVRLELQRPAADTTNLSLGVSFKF